MCVRMLASVSIAALSPGSLGCKARARREQAVRASCGVISSLVSPVMLNLNYHSSSHGDTSFILMWLGRRALTGLTHSEARRRTR